MKPVRYKIVETDEVLVSHSGLALVGGLLGKTSLKKQLNKIRIKGKPKQHSLGLKSVPSSATLRQRMDDLAQVDECFGIIQKQNQFLLGQHTPVITSSAQEWVPLDIDPSPFDNSGTKNFILK